MSVLIIGVWGIGLVYNTQALGANLFVPLNAAIAAGITAALSIVSYFFMPQQHAFKFTLIAYLFLVATILMIIYNTGHLSSPFIALWMLACIFSALFGMYGLLPVVIVSVGYGVYLTSQGLLSQQQVMMFALAFELPAFVSYLIWHKKSTHENEKDKAYSALAQELNQVASKSEIVINAIADGVVAIDAKGTIQLINPAGQQIIGWRKNDAIGLDYRSVLKLANARDEALTEENDIIQQVLHTNKTIACDDLNLTSNSGKKMIVSLLVSPVGSMGAGAIIVFRDITQDVAEERQQAEFISTASHEMRTPVAAIEGYLGLALNPNTATIDAKAQAYLTKAHESAQHLGRLFQDLLDVSKAEDGRLKNTPVVVDIVSFARDVTTSLTAQAQAKGLVLLYKPDIDQQQLSPVFYGSLDRDHLREVLNNIVENAIKYTKQGDVTVDVTGDEDHVTIIVSDTGIGIPREDIAHLFQKFYRVDSSDTREIGGTGLGLYLSRRLVEAMGGRLWVESEYGKGSKFFIEFSRISNEEAMQKIEAQASEPAQSIVPIQQSLPPLPGQPSTYETPQPQQVSAQPAITVPSQPTQAQVTSTIQPPAPAVPTQSVTQPAVQPAPTTPIQTTQPTAQPVPAPQQSATQQSSL